MKTKLIYSLLLSIFCLSAYAESQYKSYFGDTYTKWYVVYGGCEYTWGEVYTVKDKTEEIDGITYRHIFFGEEDDSASGYLTDSWYLREDRTTGRLFFRPSKQSPEILVQDLSVNVGDSIRLCGDIDEDWGWAYFSYDMYWRDVVITEDNVPYAIVDSVYYSNGLKHIRTTAKFQNFLRNFPSSEMKDTLKFVETIGSNITPWLDYRASV